MHGQKIRTLVNEEQAAGEYSVRFDAADLPGGIYFVRLQAGDRIETAKMILLR
ncbi:MAG: T9SS type A sorting domain-containing protein [Bacteroidales bacterium]|nr:T9SS type A sorting domain-containing protein [Bacteroidales bacterium]